MASTQQRIFQPKNSDKPITARQGIPCCTGRIEFGERHETAWDLYQTLVKEAGGGTPLTPATLPDWSGVYRRTRGRTNFDPDQKRGELPTAKLTPEAHAEMMDRIEKTRQGIQFDPISTCLSPGVPRWLDMPFLRDFYVTPGTTIMIAEAYNSVRRIYTDGRDHLPEDERYPTHNGDSIGIWDGDRLLRCRPQPIIQAPCSTTSRRWFSPAWSKSSSTPTRIPG